MKTAIIALCLALLLGACGNGRWGSEVRLALVATDEEGQPLSPGDVLTLAGGDYTLTLERACLSVETAVVAAEASGATAPVGEDCYCHGDPPECHGDCGEPSAESQGSAVVGAPEAVVDLLAGPTELLVAGAAPAHYATVSFVYHHAGSLADPPAACADLDGQTFLLEGTLTEVSSGTTWALTVDLRVADHVTEPLAASPEAEATSEAPAELLVAMHLEHVLEGVDFAAVTGLATGATITIGGADDAHPAAAEQVAHGLAHAGSYAAAARE